MTNVYVIYGQVLMGRLGPAARYTICNADIRSASIDAFSLAERLNSQTLTGQRSNNPRGSTDIHGNVTDDQQQVVRVGAGIVNLITAYYLLANGYRVTIFYACGNPYDTAVSQSFQKGVGSTSSTFREADVRAKALIAPSDNSRMTVSAEEATVGSTVGRLSAKAEVESAEVV